MDSPTFRNIYPYFNYILPSAKYISKLCCCSWHPLINCLENADLLLGYLLWIVDFCAANCYKVARVLIEPLEEAGLLVRRLRGVNIKAGFEGYVKTLTNKFLVTQLE